MYKYFKKNKFNFFFKFFSTFIQNDFHSKFFNFQIKFSGNTSQKNYLAFKDGKQIFLKIISCNIKSGKIYLHKSTLVKLSSFPLNIHAQNTFIHAN